MSHLPAQKLTHTWKQAAACNLPSKSKLNQKNKPKYKYNPFYLNLKMLSLHYFICKSNNSL